MIHAMHDNREPRDSRRPWRDRPRSRPLVKHLFSFQTIAIGDDFDPNSVAAGFGSELNHHVRLTPDTGKVEFQRLDDLRPEQVSCGPRFGAMIEDERGFMLAAVSADGVAVCGHGVDSERNEPLIQP